MIVGIIKLDPDAVNVDRILPPAEDDFALLLESGIDAVEKELDLFLDDLVVEVVDPRDLDDGVIAQEDIDQLPLGQAFFPFCPFHRGFPHGIVSPFWASPPNAFLQASLT